MFKESHLLTCLALVMALAFAVQAAPLAPNDASIADSLCLWLRNPEVNYDLAAGIWTDISGKGNDARADVDGFVGPALSFGDNPAVFSSPFSAVHCDPTLQELMRSTNLNGGQGLTDLTIFSIQKLVERGGTDQRAVGFGAYSAGDRADNFNMSFDVTVRKNNGYVAGKNQDHPVDEFVIYVARMDPASIDMWFNSTGTLSQAFTAQGSSYTTSGDEFYVGELRYSPGGDFDVAEVVVFNSALTDAQVEGISEWLQSNVGGPGNPLASRPNPADGSLYENTWANMGWSAGYYAVSHDLYFGTAFDDVDDGAEGTFVGNLASNSQVVGFAGFPAPEGLQPGMTYYWRVDEVNDANVASPWKGDVWSFTVPPKMAYDPEPADGLRFVDQEITLSWTAGFGTKLHSVYFGDDFDAVSNAAGAPPQPEATYTTAALELEKTYYWRVDEFDGAVTHKGQTWSFTTVPDVAVTDPDLALWWTLDEGAGMTAVDWSGHGNHGDIAGDAQWVDGYYGSALTFGSDVYVEADGYDGVTGTAARTCCAWIRAAAAGNQNIMSWGRNVAGQKWRMRVEGTGGLRVEVNGGYHYGVTNIADGQWHHVAVTFEDDGTPDVLDTLLYVDGQLDATADSADEPVDTGVGPVRIGESPWHNAPFMNEIDDARVYTKALTQEEITLVMRGDLLLAWSPSPATGATPDIANATPLSWSPGDAASQHDVYFGVDIDAVKNADASDESGIYRGRQNATTYSPAEGVEWGGGPYYWRVDEIAADGVISKGGTWTFAVADFIAVDDFESYNDIAEGEPESNRIYLTWVDGFGTTTNGAFVGNMDVPLTERGNTHGGAQAMPLSFDNNLKISEATMTLVYPRDWTEQGVTKLSLWFRGDTLNTPQQMFVALNGNAVVYHEDPAVTQITPWTEWVIDLQAFPGVSLTNVNTITIGFGTKNSPVAGGGSGQMYFDDIRLIR